MPAREQTYKTLKYYALPHDATEDTSAPTATMSTWTLNVFGATNAKAFEREFVADATTSVAVLPECKIRCTDQDTLLQLVVLLCDEVVKHRRDMSHDYSVDQHGWRFKILRPGKKSFEKRIKESRTNEESSDVCPWMEITSPFLRCAATASLAGNDDDIVLREPGAVEVSSNTKLGDLQTWGISSKEHLEYDMGTTTNVFLRVIARETTKEGDILGLIREE